MKRTLLRLGGPVQVTFVALLAAVVAVSLVPVSAQAPGPWKQLFNGKDLTNFTVAGRGGAPAPDPNTPVAWHVEDGVLIGGQGTPEERRGSLATTEKFYDFELELEFQLAQQGTACSEELGPNEENMSQDHACLYNSGISYRSGYQLNIGRRDAGEYIGLVIHRVDPKAIRGNILWLDHGDREFPGLRKMDDWNTLRIAVKGNRHETWLNGTKIVDVEDVSTLESEAAWREPQPISIQYPYVEDFPGFVKYRNIRIRTL